MNTLTVPATFDSLTEIAAFVLKAADAAGVGGQARYRLRLAVDEIATNVVVHGCAGQAGTIDLCATMDDQALTVAMEDSGAEFDPRMAAPPQKMDLPPDQRDMGGLGVFLALQGVDRFFYERVGDRNRNVFIVKRPPRS